MSWQADLEELEETIKEMPGVLGCVVLRGVDGRPSEVQAFTQIGTDRDSIHSMIMEEISKRDLGSPVGQVFVFELEAESYFGDLESLERAAEFAEQEARVQGPIGADGSPEAAPEVSPSPAVDVIPLPTRSSRPALRRVALSSASWRSEAEVALGTSDQEVIGHAASEKTPHGLKVLAQAALGAVSKIVPDIGFELRSAALVNVSGHEAVLVIVTEDGRHDVMGGALTRGGPLTEAAVRATLDAVNRRLAAPRP